MPTTTDRGPYVLVRVEGPMKGWYWCGAGNPQTLFTDDVPRGARYPERSVALRQATYLDDGWEPAFAPYRGDQTPHEP